MSTSTLSTKRKLTSPPPFSLFPSLSLSLSLFQYLAKFAADDQPDWNAAKLVAVDELLPGAVRLVTLEAEVSRERIPLRNAYLSPGQRARVRVLGGGECAVPVASPPPHPKLNHDALVMARGDIKANETKTSRELTSASARVQLWVTEADAPDLWAAKPGETLVELGPFEGTGADLRGVAGAFAFPTLVLFVSGEGAAAARALLGASPGAGGWCCASAATSWSTTRPPTRARWRSPTSSRASGRGEPPRPEASTTEGASPGPGSAS